MGEYGSWGHSFGAGGLAPKVYVIYRRNDVYISQDWNPLNRDVVMLDKRRALSMARSIEKELVRGRPLTRSRSRDRVKKLRKPLVTTGVRRP